MSDNHLKSDSSKCFPDLTIKVYIGEWDLSTFR